MVELAARTGFHGKLASKQKKHVIKKISYDFIALILLTGKKRALYYNGTSGSHAQDT